MVTKPLASRPTFFARESGVLWVLWLTYGSFYFCRNNLAVALPGIQTELGYTKSELGTVLMALKLTYGLGQFINGQLAERFAPRRLLAVGMFGSAALNVLFGLETAFNFLLFVWACNGYAQALGWTPTMRVTANWFPAARRGRAIGLIGTGYQLGGALTFVIAGWAVERFGWRGALYLPAMLLLVTGVHMLLFLSETPASNEFNNLSTFKEQTGSKPATGRFRANIKLTLSNPALWLVAVSLLLLDACRYGFTDWGVTQLKEVAGDSVSLAAFKYAVLPFGGMAGAYLSGWATDRFFSSRRAPMIFFLLVTLGLLAVAYNSAIHRGLVVSTLVLFLVGFCIFGAQVLLVGTFPVDLARRGTAAAAVGFVNFMGYMGAAGGDKLTGHLAENMGWKFAVLFWAGCAFLAAATIAFLWKAQANRVEGTELSAPCKRDWKAG